MGFSFKRFDVSDSRSAMKVGTDSVLLGAWMRVPEGPARLLDIGSGSGVLALMAAQRAESPDVGICAVEIDGDAAADARENFASSPWSGRLDLVECAVQDFAPERRFDLIFSNPPYYDDSLPSPDEKRSTARHTATLDTCQLLDSVNRLLAPDGLFAVVIPYESAAHFIFEARCRSLHLARRCDVRTTEKRPPRRALLEFSPAKAQCVQSTLTIQQGPAFTDEYRALTKDFYLRF